MLNLLILCLIVESFKLLLLNCSKFIIRVLQIGIGTILYFIMGINSMNITCDYKVLNMYYKK